MKKIGMFVLVILLVASASVVMARPYRGGERDVDRGGRAWAFQKLNLTEEQTEKVKALRESLRNDITPIRVEMVKKQTEMKLLWMQDNPDPAKIKAQEKEILDLRGRMAEKFIDYRLAFYQILTPEQRAELLVRGAGKRGGFRRGMVHPEDRGMSPAPRW